MYKVLVVLYLLIYTLVFYIKLDILDRLSLFYTITNPSKYVSDIPFSTSFLKYFIHFLLIPFKPKEYFSQFTEGGLYTSYLLDILTIDELNKLNSKLYWNDVFIKNGILHPKLVVVKEDGIITYYGRIENKYYIQKPIYGTLGNGVIKIHGKDIQSSLTRNDNIIIQEMLSDCTLHDSVRRFRFVSLYDGSLFITYDTVSSDDIANHTSSRNGGYIKTCFNADCTHLSSLQKDSLNNMQTQLSNLHKNEYNIIFSIGWDVLFHCDASGISSYCVEGNILHSSWFYPEKICNDVIKEYKDKLSVFLKEKIYTH
jgi:hypothetical protein